MNYFLYNSELDRKLSENNEGMFEKNSETVKFFANFV